MAPKVIMDRVCKEGSIIKPRKPPIQWKHTLIGKPLVTDVTKVIKPSDVIKDAKKAWVNTIARITTMVLDDGCVSFHFEDPRDMQWVMDSRPWLVSKKQYLLLLIKLRPYTPPSKVKFSYLYPFWVQLHDVPYELMSRKLARRIGKYSFHELLEVDFDGTKRKRKKFLRIRVLVDVAKKLSAGCWLTVPKESRRACRKEVSWVAFKYEELPKVCFRCGITGHTEEVCANDLPQAPIVGTISYNPKGKDHLSVLPRVLAQGHVLRDVSKRGYGPWIYDQIGWEDAQDAQDYVVISDDEVDDHEDENEDKVESEEEEADQMNDELEEPEAEDTDEAENEDAEMNNDKLQELADLVDELVAEAETNAEDSSVSKRRKYDDEATEGKTNAEDIAAETNAEDSLASKRRKYDEATEAETNAKDSPAETNPEGELTEA